VQIRFGVAVTDGGGDARIGCGDGVAIPVRGSGGPGAGEHPLRVIREVVNEVLVTLDAEFSAMYSDLGRASIPPERLLRGSLIQAFYTIRSERQLMEQLSYNLLFRWFVGLGIDDLVWDHSTYSKNRDRLLEADVAKKFLKAILVHRKVAPLLSDDHFTVDGTLVQAWASMKSFVAKEPTPPPEDGPGSGARTPSEPAEKAEMQASAEAADKAQPASTETPMPTADANKSSRNEEVDFHGQNRSTERK
jgi:transposase